MKAVFVLLGLITIAAAITTSDCSGSDAVCKSVGIDLDGAPTKGNPIGMKWKVACGQHEFISNLHIYVGFNGFSFHEEEVGQSAEVAGGSQSEIDYKVTIPSFAPSGHYQVNLTAQGNSDDPTKRDTNLNCISVEFDL